MRPRPKGGLFVWAVESGAERTYYRSYTLALRWRAFQSSVVVVIAVVRMYKQAAAAQSDAGTRRLSIKARRLPGRVEGM